MTGYGGPERFNWTLTIWLVAAIAAASTIYLLFG